MLYRLEMRSSFALVTAVWILFAQKEASCGEAEFPRTVQSDQSIQKSSAAEVWLMLPVKDLPSTQVGTKVLNGVVVNTSDWRHILYSCKSNTNSTGCAETKEFFTATIVGRGVALTCAHCVKDKAIMARWNNTTFPLNCVAPDEFVSDYLWDCGGYDYALCIFDEKYGPQNTGDCANVSVKMPKRGESVLIVGYGCTSVDMSGQPIESTAGSLHLGTVPVSHLLGEDPISPYYLGAEGLQGSCEGDSGAAIWRYTNNSHFKPRWIVGVASCRRTIGVANHTSLSPTGSQEFTKFAEKIETKYNRKLCWAN